MWCKPPPTSPAAHQWLVRNTPTLAFSWRRSLQTQQFESKTSACLQYLITNAHALPNYMFREAPKTWQPQTGVTYASKYGYIALLRLELMKLKCLTADVFPTIISSPTPLVLLVQDKSQNVLCQPTLHPMVSPVTHCS